MTTPALIQASDARDFVPDAHLLGIRDVLYKIARIFPPDQKLQLLEACCMVRMEELGIGLLRDYFEYLTATSRGRAETTLLLNEILGNEKCFFRGKPQLDALHKIILPKLIAAKLTSPSRTIKIWSAGCSTGEEAYSLAITLLEASDLLEGWTCTILATDINEQAVEHAGKAVYSADTIRNLAPDILQKYFVKQGNAFSLCLEARNLITFQHLSLLDDRRRCAMTGIDIIFCRNVLVYLDNIAKAQVLEQFHNSLSPGGILFLDPAESLFGVTSKFLLVHLPSANAYTKIENQMAGSSMP